MILAEKILEIEKSPFIKESEWDTKTEIYEAMKEIAFEAWKQRAIIDNGYDSATEKEDFEKWYNKGINI